MSDVAPAPRPFRRSRPLLTGAACALAVAAIGGALTDIGPWYQGLVKPAFQPPDWAFGPAWTLIFALCALAGAEAWVRAPQPRVRAQVVALFTLNAALNIGWSLLFFRLHRPDWALYEVPFLWLSILVLVVFCGRFAPRVRWLLAPYLAWVTFATGVNAGVVRLNGPFV